MANPVLIDAFSKPMMGGELPYFTGKQYGSGWLRTIGRFAFPLLQRVGRFFGNTAKDVLVNEKPIKEALKTNAINEVANIIPSFASTSSSSSTPSTSSKAKRRKIINKQKNSKGTIFAK